TLRERLGGRGQAVARERFAWSIVAGRYLAGLADAAAGRESVARHAAMLTRLPRTPRPPPAGAPPGGVAGDNPAPPPPPPPLLPSVRHARDVARGRRRRRHGAERAHAGVRARLRRRQRQPGRHRRNRAGGGSDRRALVSLRELRRDPPAPADERGGGRGLGGAGPRARLVALGRS